MADFSSPIGSRQPNISQKVTQSKTSDVSSSQAEESVIIEGDDAVLADALDGVVSPEEATQMENEASLTGQTRSTKKLDERKTGRTLVAKSKKSDSDVDSNPQKIEDKFVKLLPDLNRTHLKDFVKDLLDDNPKSQEDALRRAMGEFEDASHQYAALEFAEARFQQQVDSASTDEERQKVLTSLKYVKDAYNDLLKREGSAIRAGVNVSALADASAKEGLGSIQDLRSCYRNRILGHVNAVSTFKALIEEFGQKNLSQAVSFVRAAASHDLACEGPSIPEAKLGDIIDDLYTVQVLTNVSNRVEDLLKLLKKEYSIDRLEMDTTQVTLKLFELIENPTAGALGELAASLGIPEDNLQAKERFIREAKEFLRLIPEKEYSNLENRSLLQSNCQMELDAVTNQLEEIEGTDDEDTDLSSNAAPSA